MEIQKIDSYLKSGDFLEETVNQLVKDFLMVGVNFDIEKQVKNYKYLFDFTFHLINTLNERNPKTILTLLYRIDLPEEKVKEEMKKTKLSFTEMLSEMIVKRELQKIIIKDYYSNTENR